MNRSIQQSLLILPPIPFIAAISKPSDSRIRPTKLMLEVPEAKLDLVKEKLPQIMAKVDEGMLNVPLVAEVGVGMNWEEAH